MPPSIIPKGIATSSLLSQVITGKFQYGLPLYRQEALFQQYGIELSRRTMSDWMQKCADALQRFYDRLHQILLEQLVIQADETQTHLNFVNAEIRKISKNHTQVMVDDKGHCFH